MKQFRTTILYAVCSLVFLLFSALSCKMWVTASALWASEIAVFQGRVLDVDGGPVAGASVFVYTGPQVRRPADFISAETTQDGKFRMVIPPGTYWAVARMKKGEKYGPLMPGDKHSGEPETFELASGTELTKDFTVADIRDAARQIKKTRKDIVKVRGKIVDAEGRAVKDAYVAVWKTGREAAFPDYLSASTDQSGLYTVYLPRGKYSFSAVTRFPPGQENSRKQVILIETERPDVDIIIQSANSKREGLEQSTVK